MYECETWTITSREEHRLRVFISVINQLDAQNLFYNKFYFMPLHVSSTCAHHQVVKIVLHSLWYHHTYRWPSRAQVHLFMPLHVSNTHVLITRRSKLHYTASGIITPIGGRLVHRCTFSCLYMFRAHMCSSSGGKIALHSFWYHHTYRWPSRARDDHL